MKDRNEWLAWANELQSLAQAGLYYNSNVYDIERYERIRDISGEMMAAISGLPVGTIQDLFCSDSGYLTPKLDTRAAVFRDDKILLVQEISGKWALPGGWVDIDQSIMENAVKEVYEEAGLEVAARRLIAVIDRDKHNLPRYARKIVMCFVLCESLGGQFRPNSETTASGYFSLDELPEPLATAKTTKEELQMCFDAYHNPDMPTFFD